MKTKIYLTICAISLLITANFTLAAEKHFYKYKDKEGVTRYSDRRPSAIPDKDITRIVQKSRSISHKKVEQDKTNENTETKKKTNSSYSKWKEDSCKVATQNIDILSNSGRVKKENSDELMSDEEIQNAIKTWQERQSKYCNDKSDVK